MSRKVLCILSLIYDRESSFRPHLACFLALLFSVAFLHKADAHSSSWPRVSAAGRQGADTRPLSFGIPIERALTSGESHSYQITLAADQYLQVEVAQRGINVILELFDPTGKRLTEIPLRVLNDRWIAGTTSSYDIQAHNPRLL
jgi:hypothetical protein